jgi:lysosomal Pro-X carboxypeptidase
MMAAWMRMNYPHIVQGALASSAPIRYFEGSVSPYAYNEVATDAFAKADPNCPNTIRKAFQILDEWKSDST